jgi:hypothetical protein
MSSSRANAAARQRRAGDTQTTQQSSYNSTGSKTRFVQQQQEPPQPPVNPKLSISDAIALITLRLGRVENIVSNYDPSAGPNGGNIQLNYDENMRMVDEQVFNSIVTRLDALEKGKNARPLGQDTRLEQRLDVLEKNQKMLIEKQQSLAVTLPSETTVVNDVTEEKLKPVEENIQSLKDEIKQIKDILLKLQSFTMETNQKLADIVFEEHTPLNNAFMMSLHNNSEFVENPEFTVLDDCIKESTQLTVNTGIDSDIGAECADNTDLQNLTQSTNLREMVKQELMNDEREVSLE